MDNVDPKVMQLLETNPVRKYHQMMVENLAAHYPKLEPSELAEAVDWAIANNHQIGRASLDNNYTKKCIDGTTLDILRFIDKLKPIESASGVLYKRHDEIDNPLSRMIQGFIKQRKKYKNLMFESPKGSYKYNVNNLMQANFKTMA